MVDSAAGSPDYCVGAHQCLDFTNGACVAKFCSNADMNVTASSQWIATQLTLLDNSCVTQKSNGVMARCSDDSFAGSCAWWQLWLESQPELFTNGNPPGSAKGAAKGKEEGQFARVSLRGVG